jgi:hypothetical protein
VTLRVGGECRKVGGAWQKQHQNVITEPAPQARSGITSSTHSTFFSALYRSSTQRSTRPTSSAESQLSPRDTRTFYSACPGASNWFPAQPSWRESGWQLEHRVFRPVHAQFACFRLLAFAGLKCHKRRFSLRPVKDCGTRGRIPEQRSHPPLAD